MIVQYYRMTYGWYFIIRRESDYKMLYSSPFYKNKRVAQSMASKKMRKILK